MRGEGGTLLRAERAGRMCVGCHRDLLWEVRNKVKDPYFIEEIRRDHERFPGVPGGISLTLKYRIDLWQTTVTRPSSK